MNEAHIPAFAIMSDSNMDFVPPSLDPGEQELAQEFSCIQKKDSWISRYAVFVSCLLVAAIVTLAALALHQGTSSFLKLRMTEAVFALVALIVLFNLYMLRQELLIKQLRAQLTEKRSQFYNLRNLSMIDPLTDLYNRRFAEQRLAAEVARTQRMGHPLALLMLDLKGFKQLNDRHGRDAGDQALRAFGARMTSVIRSSDLAVRLEGDKFMILLPECVTEQLNRILSRLTPFEFAWNGQKVPVAFTAACKQFQIGETPEGFLARADQSLVSAKRAGDKAPHFETLTL
jgi:diguanylate cyclase (GGDEF)-like protein